MMLASYLGTRPGWQGVANRVIRWRFGSQESHSEIVFEPGDGVDDLMPDGTCEPDAAGALWCFSFVAAERIPKDSPYRPGKVGGGRFKRVVLVDQPQWRLQRLHRDARTAALLAVSCQGQAYAWRLVLGWVAWLLGKAKATQQVCSQFAAAAAGLPRPERFDPGLLADLVEAENNAREAAWQ